jgi:hypothetical protein
MRILRFEFRRPQVLAAAMLLLFVLQCLWIVRRQVLTSRDYQYARCGRELWEKPSPLAGYLTSCGNISDGTFAYRAAGLPLTLERIVAGESASTSTWEMRHLVWNVLFLLHLPFILFGVWLGGAIWWVSRRLYGNEGGFIALALYCFCPAVLRVAVMPNNEILAAWGLFGVVYTAIGLAHTMQGPLRRWVPRTALLALALGLTATAHAIAALLGWLLAFGFMLYLARGRRAQVLPVLAISSMGAFLVLLASYTFNLDAISYLFQSGDAFLKVSWEGSRYMLLSVGNACIVIAGFAALAGYLLYRRSRYFGNTTPLLAAFLLLSLATTGVHAEPWVWALPFIFTFIGGVFADMLETRHRRAFLRLTGAIVVAQAVLCLASLHLLAG